MITEIRCDNQRCKKIGNRQEFQTLLIKGEPKEFCIDCMTKISKDLQPKLDEFIEDWLNKKED